MGIVRMGPPEPLVQALQRQFNIRNFVETGTFRGGTTRWAAGQFASVYTIEFSEDRRKDLEKTFEPYPNVVPLFGDSRSELAKLQGKLSGGTMFWLDAHWCGGDTYGSDDECPLLDELEAVAAHQRSGQVQAFVLIDDARLFLSPPPAPHRAASWPTISACVKALEATLPDPYIVVIDDVIVAVPPAGKDIVEAYCRETNARLWRGSVVDRAMRRGKNAVYKLQRRIAK